jgi:transcriptional regulator with XRE-family HTH domain
MSAFMETLQRYLENEGITQAQFARMIDDSLQNVNRYVKHGRIPSPEKVILINEVTRGRVSYESWFRRKHEESINGVNAN